MARLELIGIGTALLFLLLTVPFYYASPFFPTFLSLTDTPSDYTGQSGQVVAVNSDENALEFITVSSGGSDGTCDNNVNCTITGTINTALDGNYGEIKSIGDINSLGTIYSQQYYGIDPSAVTTFGSSPSNCAGFLGILNTFTPCTNGIDLGSAITYWGGLNLTKTINWLNGNNPALTLQSNQYAFVTTGTTNTGQKFNNTKSGITIDNTGIPIFLVSVVTDRAMIGIETRTSAPTFTLAKDFKGSSLYWHRYPDMNNILLNQKADGTFTFLEQSAYDGSSNVLQNLDINSGNLTVDGDITTDQNVFGQVTSVIVSAGTTCNTACGNITYASPWACVEAFTPSMVADTCGGTTGTRNCICSN